MAAETSPHDLIASSRVNGTPVFNPAGDRIAHVEDLSIHKVSGQVIYAILSFGGFLGIGEKFHPIPWSVLDYDPAQNGYVVALTKEELERAPTLTSEQLEELGADDAWRTSLFEYYGRYGAIPYA